MRILKNYLWGKNQRHLILQSVVHTLSFKVSTSMMKLNFNKLNVLPTLLIMWMSGVAYTVHLYPLRTSSLP
jgi:hypothetical protein